MSEENKNISYAVKLEPGVKEELQELIQTEKGTGGDFIKLLLDTYKANKLIDAVVDSKADLKELNTLTTRIYNLYANLIEKNNTRLNLIKAESIDQTQRKELNIAKIKEQLELEIVNKDIKTHEVEELKNMNLELTEELEKLKFGINKDNKLIFKLEQEVEEIASMKKENKLLIEEIKVLKNEISIAKDLNKELQDVVNLNEIKSVNSRDRFEIEKQQEILKLKQDHQIEIQTIKTKRITDIEKQQDKYIKKIENAEQEQNILRAEIKELQKKDI